MARILGLFPSALVAAKGGMSANAYYRELRDLGIAARRSEVLALYKIANGVVTKSREEPFRDISLVPSGQELAPWPTKKATGIAQTVTLTYRDKTTGEIAQTWWRTVTENGITREAAIATAIDAYSEHAISYNQDLIGAVHTSAYNMVPGLV
jgi:hypothetical protein